MDVSDAEKELARLKRRVFKLEDDIEGKEYERNALVQKRRGLEKELTALKKERQATVVDGEFSDNSAIDSKIAKIKKEISTIEGQIEKVDQAIEKGNISLEQTKNRYVEIAQKARELKAEVKDGVDSARTDEAAERRAAFEERPDRRAPAKEFAGNCRDYFCGRWFHQGKTVSGIRPGLSENGTDA